MKNLDLKISQEKRNEIFAKMNKAAAENDKDKFMEGWQELSELTQENILETVRAEAEKFKENTDKNILASRGVRQLTGEETKYYEKVIEALRGENYKEAIANLDVAMPETVIDAVFDELQSDHPLLSKISFVPSTGLTKMLMNENPYQAAAWGKLCDEIIKELTSGLKEVNMEQLKLSAFVFVCKAMLDLGPVWLDAYVRQMLYEALANGAEVGFVSGTGKDEPIGMIRQVGEDVTVSGGVYPEKTPIKITAFSMGQVGNLVSQIAVDGAGKPRKVRDLVLLVNPIDYYSKVLPAVMMMRPDGSYASIFPVDCEIIETMGVPQGKAVFGMAYKYFAGLGTAKEGKIEFSDQYRFLEDERTYLIKLYGNGFPMDNNAFLLLDISELQPFTFKVEQIVPDTVADDAGLSALQIGSVALTPAFDSETTTYTAETSNATNIVKVTPTKASAEVVIKLGDTAIQNGSPATWTDGANTLTIDVTDGKETKKYTVTVTKK